jgi:hypothetical protein
MSVDLRIDDPLPGYGIGWFAIGEDAYHQYRLGDQVDYVFDRYEPGTGYLLDGVFPGYVYPPGCAGPEEAGHPVVYSSYHPRIKPAWLAIKDHKIHSVWLMQEADFVGGCSISGMWAASAYHAKRLDIKPPPAEAWTIEQWAEKAKRDYARKVREYQCEAELYGLSKEERAMKLIGDSLRDKLREESIADKIMPPLEVPNEPTS